MLKNLWQTAAFRVKNATSDRFLYHREHRFVPSAAEVAARKREAVRTEAENRLLGQYLDYTAAAVGNRAEFDAKWTRASIAYEVAKATREAATAEVKTMREDIDAAKELPVAERSPRLNQIREKTRKAYSISGNPIGVS
jgi:hypothetical protein